MDTELKKIKDDVENRLKSQFDQQSEKITRYTPQKLTVSCVLDNQKDSSINSLNNNSQFRHKNYAVRRNRSSNNNSHFRNNKNNRLNSGSNTFNNTQNQNRSRTNSNNNNSHNNNRNNFRNNNRQNSRNHQNSTPNGQNNRHAHFQQVNSFNESH